jgi:hypothetical protein
MDRGHLKSPGVINGRIILRWIFRKKGGVAWTGLSCLKIGAGDGHLGMR